MIPKKGRIRGHALLRRVGHARFRTVGATLLRVWRIRWLMLLLMLRIGRLGRGHAVVMHGGPAVVAWAVCPIRHMRIGRRGTIRAGPGARATLLHEGNRRSAAVVRVPNAV